MKNEWLIKQALRKLVNVIIENCGQWYSNSDEGESVTWKDILDWINSVKMIEWIPCTERLPDYDKDVLLTYAYDGSVFIGHLYQAIEYKTTGFRTFEKIYVDQWVVEYEGYTHDFNSVSAWAELPEGYKKGGGSE